MVYGPRMDNNVYTFIYSILRRRVSPNHSSVLILNTRISRYCVVSLIIVTSGDPVTSLTSPIYNSPRKVKIVENYII